ncbi:MAG: cation transporter [Candidatus Margulisiibacteriota bacterium]|nr:MAG: cation transporter [Candidatus Margulisiibacteriota bacterium]HCY37758.1 cation transporter [Candidatus Margulisiibacteriota bacterium]
MRKSMEKQKQKIFVAMLSVFSNSALIIAKLVVGILISSVSVISEAIHSGVDLLASIIALFAVKTSSQPADREHAFGHGKFENLSGVVEALLIFVAAGWIIFVSIKKLITPQPMEAVGWGVAVMLASSIVNIIVSQMLFKVGKETDSIALQADAWHLRTDVFTSAGVMGGLGLFWLGKILVPDVDLHWIDPVSALLVAILILKAAYDLTKQSLQGLLDESLPPDEENWIKERIKLLYHKIYGFHNFRTRKAGSTRFVEFHVVVNPEMSVQDSHDLNDKIVTDIKHRFPDSKIMVHIEPCNNLCEPKCLDTCLIYNR